MTSLPGPVQAVSATATGGAFWSRYTSTLALGICSIDVCPGRFQPTDPWSPPVPSFTSAAM